MDWTSTALLASIKRRAQVPTAQGTFTTADLLAIANEQMLEYVAPLVLGVREEFWVKSEDLPIVNDDIAYPIPYRALMGKLREVTVLDDQWNVRNIPRVNPGDLQHSSRGFWLEGNSVWLVTNDPGTVTSDYGVTLRLAFHMRPGAIVDTTAAATIASFNAAAKTVTLASVPAAFSGHLLWDIVGAKPPFDTLTWDDPGSLSGSTITFTDSLPDLTVGDYVCLPEQSPVPQIPGELHGLLAQKCAIKVLEAKQQLDKLAAAREELARLEADARTVLTPRVDGEAVRVFNRASLYRARF